MACDFLRLYMQSCLQRLIRAQPKKKRWKLNKLSHREITVPRLLYLQNHFYVRCLLAFLFLPSFSFRSHVCLSLECAISYFNGKWFMAQRLWNWMRKDREIFAYITLSTTIKFGISFEMLRIHFACCTFHNKA